MTYTRRFLLITGFAVSAFAAICSGQQTTGFKTMEEAQKFAASLPPGKVATIKVVEKEESATGKGSDWEATGDATKAQVDTTAPGAQTSKAKSTGGAVKGGLSAEQLGSDINLLMVLGGLFIAAGIAGLFLAPVLKKFCIAAIAVGAVLFGLGWIVTGGIAVLAALAAVALLAGLCVWLAYRYHLLDDTATRIVGAIGKAPDSVKEPAKAEINKATLEVNDTVIDGLKRKAGV